MSGAADHSAASPVARLRDVNLVYGTVRAIDGVSLDVPAGRVSGLIGPDGVGKSSLLSLMSGARALQGGTVEGLGGSMAAARPRPARCPPTPPLPPGPRQDPSPTPAPPPDSRFLRPAFGPG
ncbi:ATP-binding cassette domain-containing protein, partial [Azospirillum brasilense]|nr:ATP-binding cassette domain-containing protein [Azospirillum brasilense]